MIPPRLAYTAKWAFALSIAVTISAIAEKFVSEEALEQPSAKASATQVMEIPDQTRKLQLTPPTTPHIATTAFLTEVEPNDTTGTAQALPSTPVRLRGDLYKFPIASGDVDVYSFTATAGDRVYAGTMTFASGMNNTVLDIIASDGMTVLETDDEDGGIGPLTGASNIGGTVLATAGTYYVRVKPFDTTLFGIVSWYDLYVRVLSGSPIPETEPNDNGTPQALPPNGWVSGVIGPALGDTDTFAIAANAGDTIVAILDVDPERDAPEWDARLGIGVFNSFFLIVNGSGVGGPSDDANPSEALYMTVKTTGTYQIYVDEAAGGGAATFTYHLSVNVIPGDAARIYTTYPGTGGPIADQPGTTDFTMVIPDAKLIDNLRLSMNETHAGGNTAHLDISLISPDGNEVVLSDDPGTTTSAPVPQIDNTIDDEAAVPTGVFSVHNGMYYTPEFYGRMAYFKGMQIQGTWTLRIRDDQSGSSGTLNSWSLSVAEDLPTGCTGPITNIYSSTFETGDDGFTHSGTEDEWARGLPGGASAPITSCHSGVNCWKTDLAGSYNAGSNQDLLSPPIDLTAVTGTTVELSWWQKYHMESALLDTAYVEVAEMGNPSNARRLWEWKGARHRRSVGSPAANVQMSGGWGQMNANLSSFTGTIVQVRYHLESSTPTFQFSGLAVDDVMVTACGLPSTPTPTPSPTSTSTPTPTVPPTPTPTPTPSTPTPTPAVTPTPTTIVSPTATPTPPLTGNGKIAFQRQGFFGNNYDVYVMDPDGSNLTNLTNSLIPFDQDPHWSPDGTKIVFYSNTDDDSNFDIYVMDANGGSVVRLTSHPAGDFSPAWSPDGTKVAFASERDSNVEVYVMDANGSNQIRLTNNPAYDSDPAWSPDGTKIAFVTDRDGDLEIYVMDPNGSNQVNLTNRPGDDLTPDWSRNGEKIAFSGSVPTGGGDIYVMDANGSNQTPLTHNTGGADFDPVWSPDGTKLAFTRSIGPEYDIYVMNADGSNQIVLTNDPAVDYRPDWQRVAASVLPTPTPSATPTATPTPCAPSTFSNPTAITIPDHGAAAPYPSNIAVAGLSGTITKVVVKLNNLTHSYPSDIDILLVSPGGQSARIMSDVGGSDEVSSITLTLDDAAASNMPISQLTSGTFGPTNFGTADMWPAPAPAPAGGSALSIFNGTSANGTWSLYVVDDADQDLGSFAGGWDLLISTTTGCGTPTPSPSATVGTPTPTASPTATPTPTATGTPSASPTATATPTPSPAAHAVNLSTRMVVGTGDSAGIGGFIITGTASKHVLLRAIGPSLTQFGVTNALGDPVLELHGPTGFLTIINNNWRDTQQQEIEGTGIAPTNDSESAIAATLAPGNYTGVVRGNGNTTGMALIEVYDLNSAAASRLGNISTRAFVGTGDDIVIAGFILGNNGGDDNVIVRGLGPSLSELGVPTVLANPTLELRDGNATLLSSNNDWQDDPAQAAELTAAGLAPTNNLESGIAATLPPGLYTALLAGQNNGTGIGLVEVYDLGP